MQLKIKGQSYGVTHYAWHTLGELYAIRREYPQVRKCFSGRFSSLLLAIIEFLPTKLAFPLYRKFLGLKDGYLLVLIGPIIFIWWVIITIWFLILTLPLVSLLPLSIVWLIFFEMPADIINKSWGE